MCGIAGQFKFQGAAERELVEKMTRLLVYRGPDGEGYHVKDNIGLGMRRLKIIDLKTGDQPIYNEDRTVAVVFNGEIYNYRDLKNNLSARGHKFYTNSDTEVIVHAYEEFGDKFVEHLSGMFAIALSDEKQKKLLLARDRAGEKPLYYYADRDQIVFASELKSLLLCPSIKKAIDPAALHYFLVYGRVPSPYCIINGVKKLPPAHCLTVAGGKFELNEYWKLSFREKSDAGEEELKNELLKKLELSVKRMMVSDVPLGALLSGGVDSSSVVAMMARNSRQPVETFSVGFKEQDFSELKYAKMVADKFKTNHHEIIIEPQVLEILPKLAWHLDEPFSDYSVIPAYYIAREARKNVTVVLTGDGGDELFAGYEWYKAVKIAAGYNKLPGFLRELFFQASRLLPDTDERENAIRYIHKAKRLLETQRKASGDLLSAYLNMTSGFTEEMLRREIYTDEFRAEIKRVDAYALRRRQMDEYDGDDELEALTYGQFKSLLPDMFFTKVDRASMANSLESRSPFLDHDLVEFIARIPFDLKLHNLETKYILKRAMKGLLPDEILLRHKKGFTLPLNRWLKQGELKDKVRSALLDKSFLDLGYFNRNFIENLITEHNTDKKNNADKIWRLYMLALWHDVFIK